MPMNSKYMFVASMDIEAAKEYAEYIQEFRKAYNENRSEVISVFQERRTKNDERITETVCIN